MTHLIFFVGTLVFLCAHFALYCAVLRHNGSVSSESGILLYHVKSAVLVGLAGIVFLFAAPDFFLALAAIVASAACHGIYSLTFLELWTLSQISYSRDILTLVRRENVARPEIVTRLAAVGDQKKADRLGALIKLGLVRKQGEAWVLSRRGFAVAVLLKVLLWLPDLRSHG